MSSIHFFASFQQNRLDKAEAKSIIADAKNSPHAQERIFAALQDSSIHPDVRKHLIKHSEIAKSIMDDVKQMRDETTRFVKEFKKLEHRKPIEALGKRQSATIRLQELAKQEKQHAWLACDFKLSSSVTKVIESGRIFEKK